MPVSINGNTGVITGLAVGGLPDGIVDADTLATSVTRGKVLQVIQSVKTDTFSTTGGSLEDITGLSLSITPSATSSKILITATINHSITTYDRWMIFQLVRGSTAIFKGDTAGSRTSATIFNSLGNYTGGGVHQLNSHFEYLDSPNTTSATTYKIQTTRQSDSAPYVVINRGRNDDNASYGGRSVSSITAMEVAG